MRLLILVFATVLALACSTPTQTVTVVVTATPVDAPTAVSPTAAVSASVISTPSPRLARLDIHDVDKAEFLNLPTGGTTLRLASAFAFEEERDQIMLGLIASNTGARSVTLYRSVQLQDQAGRRFDMIESPRDLLAYFRGSEWAKDFDIVPYTDTLQPGRVALVPVLFRVSATSDDLHLVPALP